MDQPIIRYRAATAVRTADVAIARRVMGARGPNVADHQLLKALWAARALPTLLDTLADARTSMPLDRTTAHVDEVQARSPTDHAVSLVAVGMHQVGSTTASVRFLRKVEPAQVAGGVFCVAFVEFSLETKQLPGSSPPFAVVQRFRVDSGRFTDR